MVRPYIYDPAFSDIAGGNEAFYATLTRVGEMSAGLTREDSFNASIALASSFNASLIRVDSEDPHYIEVSPQVAWIVNGWTSNEVFSDTTWVVD